MRSGRALGDARKSSPNHRSGGLSKTLLMQPIALLPSKIEALATDKPIKIASALRRAALDRFRALGGGRISDAALNRELSVTNFGVSTGVQRIELNEQDIIDRDACEDKDVSKFEHTQVALATYWIIDPPCFGRKPSSSSIGLERTRELFCSLYGSPSNGRGIVLLSRPRPHQRA